MTNSPEGGVLPRIMPAGIESGLRDLAQAVPQAAQKGLDRLADEVEKLKPPEPKPNTLGAFEVEFYKATRAHEVALNNATGIYEQSVLQRIMLLNTASIGGLVLIASATKPEIHIWNDPSLVHNALITWVVGVGLSFFAMWFGYKQQQNYNRAFRYRRQALEVEQLANYDLSQLPKFGIIIPAKNAQIIITAKNAQRERLFVGILSVLIVLLFVVGGYYYGLPLYHRLFGGSTVAAWVSGSIAFVVLLAILLLITVFGQGKQLWQLITQLWGTTRSRLGKWLLRDAIKIDDKIIEEFGAKIRDGALAAFLAPAASAGDIARKLVEILNEIVGRNRSITQEAVVTGLRDRATNHRERADNYQRYAVGLGVLALGCALVGFGYAVSSLNFDALKPN